MKTPQFQRVSVDVRALRLVIALLTICIGLHGGSLAEAQTSSSSGATALTTGTGAPQTVTNPLQINSSGTYYLTRDVVAATCDGIDISASNVVLDLNGHTISTSSTAAYSASVHNSGVYAANRTNLTIRNGTINGFFYGVFIQATPNSQQVIDDSFSYGHLLESLSFNHNTLSGIFLEGGHDVIRRCQITNTGGTSIQNQPSSYGILCFGPGNRVLDCDVSEVSANVTGGIGTGIFFAQNAINSFALRNRVSDVDDGIYFDASASGKYEKNLASGEAVRAFWGGTDTGGNIVDSNGNGIDDDWELSFFGNLSHTNPAEDFDGDGLSNAQEYQQGTDPTDYYNGTSPGLQITSGNGQYTIRGAALAQSLVVLVTKGVSNAPATNAPVAYQVTSGTMQISTAPSGPWSQSCTLRTDTTGHATIYCQTPASSFYSIASSIQVTAGTAIPAIFTENVLPPQRTAAGGNHSLAVDVSGCVWAWGSNFQGQLGNSTSGTAGGAPAQVVGPNGSSSLSGIVAVAAGNNHSLALKSSDGSVWAWGYNNFGQLGDGTTNTRLLPVQVYAQGSGSSTTLLTGVVAIAAGSNHSLALKNDGTVWAWGYNGYGQLGDGTTNNQTIAVQVASGAFGGVSAIAGGEIHSAALKSDGTVWTWGTNGQQLGNPTYDHSYTPIQVKAVNGSDYLSGIVALASGPSSYHTLAVKSDGTLLAWGDNGDGQLGNDTEVSPSYPVQVVGIGAPVGPSPNPPASNLGFLSGVVGVAAGRSHSLAVLSDGRVCAWGYASSGQLGINNTTGNTNGDADYPEVVVSTSGTGTLNGIISISAAGTHSMAVMGYQGAPVYFGWGSDVYGEIEGSTPASNHAQAGISTRSAPVLVHVAIDTDHDGLTDWQEYLRETNPLNPDSNGDGILDGVAVAAGLDPLAPPPALPPVDPNDHTPPQITITFPTVGITQL